MSAMPTVRVQYNKNPIDVSYGGSVKISRLGTLAFGLSLCGSILAQESNRPEIVKIGSHAGRTKQVHMTGTISNDGNTFVEAPSQWVWLIKDVGMLRGYEGQDVIVLGVKAPDPNVIQVISIKRQVSYRANWSDSAFRR